MSVNAENTANAFETYEAEKNSANSKKISTELIEERIRANLKPLSEQISTLTQLLNQVIQDNSAQTTPTAGSRTHRPQTGPSLNREIETSRISPQQETYVRTKIFESLNVRRNKMLCQIRLIPFCFTLLTN